MPWIMNRPQAALPDLPVDADTVLISITEPGHPVGLPDSYVVLADILRLGFSDWDMDRYDAPPMGFGDACFTPRMAEQVRDFATKNHGKNFIVHCAAGVSRSGAVVEALMEAFPEYEDRGWPRHPNNYVRRLCKRALGLVPIGAEA